MNLQRLNILFVSLVVGIALQFEMYAGEGSTETRSVNLSVDGNVVRYGVREPSKLEGEEWPDLVVFLTREEGPSLSKEVVEAEDCRPGQVGSAVITKERTVWCTHVATKEHPQLAGYRLELRDLEKTVIKPDAALEIPLDLLKLHKTVDWSWLGQTGKLSAAVCSFKTEKGKSVFQRFLSPIDTLVFPATDERK